MATMAALPATTTGTAAAETTVTMRLRFGRRDDDGIRVYADNGGGEGSGAASAFPDVLPSPPNWDDIAGTEFRAGDAANDDDRDRDDAAADGGGAGPNMSFDTDAAVAAADGGDGADDGRDRDDGGGRAGEREALGSPATTEVGVVAAFPEAAPDLFVDAAAASASHLLREARHGAAADEEEEEEEEEEEWMHQPIGHHPSARVVGLPPPPRSAAAAASAEDDEPTPMPPPAAAADAPPSDDSARIPRAYSDETERTSRRQRFREAERGGSERGLTSSSDWLGDLAPAVRGRAASAEISRRDGALSPASGASADDSSSSQRGGSGSGGWLRSPLASISSVPMRGEGGVMEKIFGDASPSAAIAARRRRSSSDPAVNVASMAGSVLPRTLLPSDVTHNASTGLWIAAVHTNQKALDRGDAASAAKSLEASSFETEAEARAAASARAPPRMHPFADCPRCFVCERKFALLRRPCHCRNCGVCVCSKCATRWPAGAVPGTYNIKGESSVSVCRPCDWLSGAFREALLGGDHDRAFALHATGNVNLRSPFCNVKGEVFHPIHCAAMGGNPTTLRWLIERHHCPITAPRAKKKRAADSAAEPPRPLLTSKGRSVLDIAASVQRVDALRYLVVERDVSVLGIRDLRTALLTLDAVLRRLPPPENSNAARVPPAAPFGSALAAAAAPDGTGDDVAKESVRRGGPAATPGSSSPPPVDPALFHMAEYEQVPRATRTDDSDDKKAISDDDECIICFENEIDCVATPCGHQICCLECASGLTECPVCKTESVFIRIFKP